MLAYLVRRLLLAALVFVAVSFISFTVFAAHLDPTWKFGPGFSPAREQLKKEFHLNDPVVQRYWQWLKGTVTGSPLATRTVCGGLQGAAHCRHLAVWPGVWPALGRTALLAGLATVLVTIFSLLIGTIAARAPGSALDVVL